ncbi:hypothetical protein KBTX_03015 [wastewater metagenome]|uniref:Porin domain-containing protein n=2 Tax=unclassified sequences TaxID=12908 RepID=A0A5B8RI68_9ZZZZ|nr:hypothetical protein KBTEX_03015 [uncultured organism]
MPGEPDGYRLGRGYHVDALGLTLGGYADFRYENLEGQRDTLRARDLSVFVSGELAPNWRVFSETEFGDAVTVDSDGISGAGSELEVERLYVEHDLSPGLRLRAGKFLTPIGRRNLIHAAPLAWGVSRPLTTSAPFARHASGLEAIGTTPVGDGALDFHVFLDATERLDNSERTEETFMDSQVQPNPRNAFDHAAGLRLVYRSRDDDLQLGFSVARFRLQDRPNAKRLAGVDFQYTAGGAELTGEGVYRESQGDEEGDDYGAFVQLALPLGGDFYGVASHERYRSGLFSEAADIDTVGVTYRPVPPLSIKLERRETRGEEQLAPDGWLIALSVLL